MIARYSPILVFMSWCWVAVPQHHDMTQYLYITIQTFKMVELRYRDIAK